MYNGIGLTTPRGSGTNGYIQTNKFFVRARPMKSEPREFGEGQGQGGVSRKANRDILEHDRKRQIELKLIELEDELQEQGLDFAEIAEQLEATRKLLEAASNEGEVDGPVEVKVTVTQTHQVAAKKEKQLDIMKAALNLHKIKEGEAFDRELQLQRKQERIMAREEKEREAKAKQLEWEKEKRRKEKEEAERVREEERREERRQEERRKEERREEKRQEERRKEERREEKRQEERRKEERREERREKKQEEGRRKAVTGGLKRKSL